MTAPDREQCRMLGSDGYAQESRTPREKVGETRAAAGGRAGPTKARESKRLRARQGRASGVDAAEEEDPQARQEGQATIAAQGEEAGEKEVASRGSLISPGWSGIFRFECYTSLYT